MNRALRDSLKRLTEFAVDLTLTATESLSGKPFPTAFSVSTKDFGTVSFLPEEAEQFFGIVADLMKSCGDATSESWIRGLVQTAILKTMDIRKRNHDVPVPQRAEKAVAEVAAALTSPHLTWVSCVPILGMKPPTRTWKLGNIAIVDISKKEAEKGVTLIYLSGDGGKAVGHISRKSRREYIRINSLQIITAMLSSGVVHFAPVEPLFLGPQWPQGVCHALAKGVRFFYVF